MFPKQRLRVGVLTYCCIEYDSFGAFFLRWTGWAEGWVEGWVEGFGGVRARCGLGLRAVVHCVCHCRVCKLMLQMMMPHKGCIDVTML